MKRFLASLLLFGLVLLAAAGPAAAAETLDVRAEINGRDIAGADSDSPIELDPTEAVPITITLRNAGNRTEDIRFVRLEGQALGLTFLTYDLGMRTSLAPGEETTFDAELDFFDLDEQATGYLGTSLRVYDAERLLLGQEDFVLDVKGRTTSTLGLFAFAVLGIAGFSITVLVLNTLRRRLASNRFVRGLQFAVAGAAVGVTLALGLAILRIDYANAEEWLPLMFLPTVIAFGIGYVAPGPLSLSIRDVREEEALQALAEEALIRRSGEQARATSTSVFIDVHPTSEPPVDSRAEEPARH
ncbi:hypothetical protein NHL50_05785 [Acidimicrobiia bacterium EGI L10123]|nr:hypothetical protein [Acidimicrobiia bacterium EGI L10123]